jgi:peptidoglycan hydrolase CwlO-like protein
VSTLAKIVAFIMLICAVAFAMTAYVLQQQATNWKTDYESLVQKTNDQISKLNKEIEKLNKDVKAAQDERDNFQKMADDYKTKVGERDAEIAKIGGDLKTANDTNNRLQVDITAIKSRLDTQATDIKTLQGEKDSAVDARNKALQAQHDAEDKQRLLEDDLANLKNQLKLTKGDLKSSSELVTRYQELYGADGIRLTSMTETPPPKIQGQVVNADNGSGIVMISVGKDDGVSDGMTFEVSRGAQFVGRLRVTTIHGQETICRIDRPMTTAPIQEGDHVTTRLK